MSWTSHDVCTETTFIRYLCIMHLYVDGGSPQWFKKKFGFSVTTIHTIVSNVRNWLVTQLPDEDISKPSVMRDQPDKYHKLLNALETRRTKKEPTLPTEYAAVFARTRAFGPRKGAIRSPKHLKVLNLPKTPMKQPDKAEPDKAVSNKATSEIVEHLLTAAAEISDGRLGLLDGVVLIAVSNGELQMTKSGLSDDEVRSALTKMETIHTFKPKSVFKAI